MPSQSAKWDIKDFFKPRVGASSQNIPQKRQFSSREDDAEDTTIVVQVAPAAPQTPTKRVAFRSPAPTPQPHQPSAWSPVSNASLPIRSPQLNNRTSTSTKSGHHALKPEHQKALHESRHTDTNEFASIATSHKERSSENCHADAADVVIEDSDDDADSLASLKDIFGRNKGAVTTINKRSLSPDDADALETERQTTLSLFTGGRSQPIVGKSKLKELQAREKSLTFDLGGMLDDHFGDLESEERIGKMRQDMERGSEVDVVHELDTALLVSLVTHDDQEHAEDDVGRLLHAVDRTEALAADQTFTFFRSPASPVPSAQHDYRDEDIPHSLWQHGDDDGLSRAFCSGIVTELAGQGELSEDFIRWTFYSAFRESRDALRQAYLSTLSVCSRHWTRLYLSAVDVQTVFHDLGAKAEVLRDGDQVELHHVESDAQRPPSNQHLEAALKLFGIICADMDMLALSKLCSIMLRLTLDVKVLADARTSHAVAQLFEKLLHLPDSQMRDHVYTRLVSDATHCIRDPVLQAQLLTHLPAASPTACQLRKTLADVFLLGSDCLDSRSSTSVATLDDLTAHLSTHVSWSLTRHSSDSQSTDYTALTARALILDVAVGPGYSPERLQRPPDGLTKDDVSTFNASLDQLTSTLHSLFTSIKDTGASHMRRTECKDALQAVYFRLLYSVHRGPRRKKHIFDMVQSGRAAGNDDDRDDDGIDKTQTSGAAVKRIGVDGRAWRERKRGEDFMRQFLKTHAET